MYARIRLAVFAALILFAFLLSLGCQTGAKATGEDVITTNSPQAVARQDEKSITATGLDTPTTLWSDSDQHSVTTPFATTGMTVAIGEDTALHLSSPKDGAIGELTVGFNEETGRVTGVTVTGVSYSASEVTIARAQLVLPLVDYAKQLSADDREKFIAAMGTLDKGVELALRAAFPVPTP